MVNGKFGLVLTPVKRIVSRPSKTRLSILRQSINGGGFGFRLPLSVKKK